MKGVNYLVVFLLLLVSCTSKKKLIDATVIAKEMSPKKVARKHVASYFDKNSVSAKMKANFNNGKVKQSISVSLRMKKDEVIWLKGSKFLTVFKVKITPTSVSYYSPLAKNYFEGDFTMLQKLLGTEINFKQLQNLFLGQSLYNVKAQKQQVFVKNNSYILSPEEQSNLFDIFFTINPSHFKLDKQSIINSAKKQRLDITYPSYGLIDDVLFPSEINIKAKQVNTFTNIDFFTKSVLFDTEFETPFLIPKGYKEIKF